MLQPLEFNIEVSAPRSEVYRAWTTSEGTRSFFAPKTNVHLGVGAPFEITFDPNDRTQGTEGCKTLAWLKEEMVAFEWVAPPELREREPGKSFVVVTLTDASGGRTHVRLVHDGWGESPAWKEQREYFRQAWPMVMGWLAQRFDTGPLDWKRMEAEAKARG